MVGEKTEVSVKAGDIAFSVYFEGDAVTSIGPVALNVNSAVVGAEIVLPMIDAAVLLRVAKIVKSIREDREDRREVCSIHGFIAPYEYPCKTCEGNGRDTL